MKRIVSIMIAVCMVLCFAACGKPAENKIDVNAKSEGSMTYDEYINAADDSDVVIEGFVQAKAYAKAYGNANLIIQDGNGAYYVYRMPFTDADDGVVVPGQKIKIKGVKTQWSGEIEIKEGTASYELLEGEYTFAATDVTSLIGKDDELIKNQNKFIAIKGAKLAKDPSYKWDGSGQQGDDLYIDVDVNGTTVTCLVETDLCNGDSEVYKAVEALKTGDTVNIEGFLYWYNGAQPWITGISK